MEITKNFGFCLVGVVLVLFINESHSASLLKTAQEVRKSILAPGIILPAPKISIGHHGSKDKDPLTLVKQDIKQVPVSTTKETIFDKFLDKMNQTTSNEDDDHDDALLSLLLSDTSTSSLIFQLGLSRRDARTIIGVLDRKTCFARVLCGLGSKEPSKNTDLLNDYAYLIGDLVINSAEDERTGTNKSGSTSIITDILDTFGKSLQDKVDDEDDDNNSNDDDDEDQDVEEEDNDKLRSGMDFKIVDKSQINHEYIRLGPFQQINQHAIHPRRIYLTRRLGRQLSQGRQCRQIRQQNICPYDTQLSKIVSRLRGIIRGEDLLSTITMTATKAIASMQGTALSSTSSSGFPEKMNVVINLNQNLTMPQPQQMSGFAALPLMTATRHQSTFSSNNETTRQGENQTLVNYGQDQNNFKPFYIVPLMTQTGTTTTTTPITPTIDPFQQLVGFLYSVGQDGNTISENISTTTEIPSYKTNKPTKKPSYAEKQTKIITTTTISPLITDEDDSVEELQKGLLSFPRPVLATKNKDDDEEDDHDEEQDFHDDDEENNDDDDSEEWDVFNEIRGKSGKTSKNRNPGHPKINAILEKPTFTSDFQAISNLNAENNQLDKENGFITIKSSQRTGRFHKVFDGDENDSESSNTTPDMMSIRPHHQYPQLYAYSVPEIPILYRAFRFLSSMIRGRRG